jgi:hypothetical protein
MPSSDFVYVSEEQIEEEINRALEWEGKGSKFPGMTYEQGIRWALDWVLGNSDVRPMDD